MKLLPVIVAVAKAQIDLPDLSNFDLSAFGLGPGTPINFPDAAEEERYFFTTATTTTTAIVTTTPPIGPSPGGSCWKCDQMSFATCASNGVVEHCHDGDEDCCFVEIREKKQNLHQLCTGCKDATACMDNQAQNFEGNSFLNFQCRPDYRLQRAGRQAGRQSVCRQCFQTCDFTVDTDLCFGAIATTATTANVMFTLLSAQADIAGTTWNGFRTEADVLGFGIPTHGRLDNAEDSATIGEIETHTAGTLNLWFKNAANGKAHTDDGAGRSGDDMVFWGLQGADQAWWSDDLKTIQSILNTATNAGNTGITTNQFS
jgi:hypothetical protein